MSESRWQQSSLAQATSFVDPQVVRLWVEQHQVVEVAQRVRRLRRDHGWTQADLAKKVGSTQPSVARFESGKLQGVGYGFVRRLLDTLEKLDAGTGSTS